MFNPDRYPVPLPRLLPVHSKMSYAFCDMQMLREASGQYVIKEFSIYDPYFNKSYTEIFAPPYPADWLPPKQRKQNDYITKRIHGITWEQGTLPYSECHDYIKMVTSIYADLYVEGDEKRAILQNIVSHARITDIGVLGCPRLDTLPKLPFSDLNSKSMHSSLSCAEQNAQRIGVWFEHQLL
ncbi:uncharacterized protein LOC127751478 [Frankliniella occidentalis]|uniref:Uncharacterized protein LOC127751478 n=1 Tax=Frankliniella occidentalis TaxID=133901 RepID=A0A9C6X8G1_FRAOC|nr:uncharacterized protein LOC127751478 [Frankliniella occidentalis]